MASQEFINNFNGGMFKDTSPLYQPDGTYRDLKNYDVITHDGHNFSVKDALGNRLIFQIPPGYTALGTTPETFTANVLSMPIGFISFPDRLIIFSSPSESANGGYGEIGEAYLTNIGQSVDMDSVTINSYTFTGYRPIYGTELIKFSKMYKIEGFGFKENDAFERVYWTDNFNQPRAINIEDDTFTNYIASGSLVSGTKYMVLGGVIEQPTGSAVYYGPGLASNITIGTGTTYTASIGSPIVIPYYDVTLLDFTPARSLGNIYFRNFGAGTKLCGNHEYFYRLSKASTGFKTTWSYGSFPVHVGKNQDSPTTPTINSDHNYVGDGTTTTTSTSTKSVQLKITDIDTNFDTIELACVQYLQDIEVPYSITIVESKTYSSSTLNLDGSIDMEDFGNVNLGTLTLDDITLAPANILKCKTLSTNKNYILAGNITERDEFDTIDFSNATFSDFIYHMPVDRQIDYCAVPNVPSFPMTFGCPFTPGVNPGSIFPKVKYFVLSGGTITYNAVSYAVGDVFEGINGVPAWVVVSGTPLIRPCFAWKKYEAINGGAPTRYNVIEAKAAVGASGDLELNYRNPAAAMHLKSYRSAEKYRFGILFYDKRGNPYYVRWLADHTFSSIETKNGLLHDVGVGGVYSNIYSLTPNGFQIDDLRIPYDVYTQIRGFSIVRAECDKTIDAQGVLWQCAHGSSWTSGTVQITPLPGYQLQSTDDSKGAPAPYFVYSFMCPDSLVSYRGFEKGFTAGDKIRVAGWLHPLDFVGSGKYHAWYDPTWTGANSDQTWSKLYTHVDGTGTNEQTITGIEGMNEGDTVVNFVPGYDFYNANLWFGANGASEPVYNGWLGGGSLAWNKGRLVGGRKIAVSLSADLSNYNNTTTYSSTTLGNDVLYHKALVNYIIDKPNQYGGTGEDSKAATLYISTGHFQPINATVIADNIVGVGTASYLKFNKVQVFGGDTFVNMCDFGYGTFNSGYQATVNPSSGVVSFAGGLSTFFPCENQVNYDLRRGRKVSDFGMQDNTFGVSYSGGGGSTGPEDYSYNDAYSSDGTMFAYPAMPVNFKNAGRFPFRIRFAGQKFPGEQVDSFRVFLTNDYKDVDGGLGEINNLRSKEGKTFFWQNHGIGYVPILERQTVSAAAGEATTLGTGGVVDRFDTISAFYGNQHQWGLTDTVDGFIWFDMRNKSVVVMSAGGGVQEITVPDGMKSFFNEVFLERVSLYYSGTYLNSPTYDATSDRPLIGTGIVSVYDPKTKMSYMTFKFKEWTQTVSDVATATDSSQYQVISKDFTIGYSHILGKFTGFYDKCPAIWHNHNQIVLSANNPKNIQKYYASDMYVPADFELGDVISVGTKEYVCTTAGTVSAYAATPSSSIFTLINQVNYVYVENEEKTYGINIEGYQYNFFYGRVVNNELETVVNPKIAKPSVFDNFIMSSNDVNFTDVTVETTDQSASDLDIAPSNRDYQYTDKAWKSSLPISTTGRMVDYFLKARFVKKNWTTNPTSLTGSVKILNFIKTIFRIAK